MEIEHCFPYLSDGADERLAYLEDLRAQQEAAGQIIQAGYTVSRMRCLLYLFMPPDQSIYGVFS